MTKRRKPKPPPSPPKQQHHLPCLCLVATTAPCVFQIPPSLSSTSSSYSYHPPIEPSLAIPTHRHLDFDKFRLQLQQCYNNTPNATTQQRILVFLNQTQFPVPTTHLHLRPKETSSPFNLSSSQKSDLVSNLGANS